MFQKELQKLQKLLEVEQYTIEWAIKEIKKDILKDLEIKFIWKEKHNKIPRIQWKQL